jgi:hypothetical protein
MSNVITSKRSIDAIKFVSKEVDFTNKNNNSLDKLWTSTENDNNIMIHNIIDNKNPKKGRNYNYYHKNKQSILEKNNKF